MTVQRLALDAGALIAMERRKVRAIRFLDLAARGDALLSVPGPVIAEWWRGRSDWRVRILDAIHVEPVTLRVLQSAGKAIAAVSGATAIDAIVMAFAAARGATVVTGDVHDLERLRSAFPAVRVLSV